MPKIFGRDPAVILMAVGVAVKLAAALGWNVSADVQTGINVAAAAVVGLAVAFMVRDGQLPAMLGLVQAGIALLAGLGFHASGDLQAAIMTGVAVIFAIVTRTQVSVPVPPIPALADKPAAREV